MRSIFNIFSQKKIKDLDKFFTHFSMLISSGVDIRTSLSIIKNEKRKGQSGVEMVYDNLMNGASLSTAFRDSGVFQEFDCNVIRAGEEGGRLSEVLEELSAVYKRKKELKSKLIHKLSYPILVLATSFMVVSILMVYVVPSFQVVFARYGGELPSITKLILKFSDYFFFVLLYFTLFGLIFSMVVSFIKRVEETRLHLDKMFIQIPVIGSWLLHIDLFKYITVMHLLISNNIPIQQAIELSTSPLTNKYVSFKLYSTIEPIIHGRRLSESLLETGFFSNQTILIISSGEDIHGLNVVFENLRNQLSIELEERSVVLTTFLEPFLIMLTGGIIALILIALYLPIFQMGNVIQ